MRSAAKCCTLLHMANHTTPKRPHRVTINIDSETYQELLRVAGVMRLSVSNTAASFLCDFREVMGAAADTADMARAEPAKALLALQQHAAALQTVSDDVIERLKGRVAAGGPPSSNTGGIQGVAGSPKRKGAAS